MKTIRLLAILDECEIDHGTNTCWKWTGWKVRGYGRISYGGKLRSLHRLMYEELVGPIPEGLALDHLCGNKACCNPRHLEPVTQAENVRRYFRSRPPTTHCGKGHEFTEENTYVVPDEGRRQCRECARLRTRRYRERKLASSGVA